MDRLNSYYSSGQMKRYVGRDFYSNKSTHYTNHSGSSQMTGTIIGRKIGKYDIDAWYGMTYETAKPYLRENFIYEGEWKFKKYDKGWLISQKPTTYKAIYLKYKIYEACANGIVRDTKTDLEWKVGPDKATATRNEARSWVQRLNLDGGGWRMPTMDELKTLYEEGAGKRNMTPLLKTTGWEVWSSETNGSSDAWYFDFNTEPVPGAGSPPLAATTDELLRYVPEAMGSPYKTVRVYNFKWLHVIVFGCTWCKTKCLQNKYVGISKPASLCRDYQAMDDLLI